MFCSRVSVMLMSAVLVFNLVGCGDESRGTDVFIITATAGPGGTINPSGLVEVKAGENQTFTITPNAGFTIFDVQVDGSSVGAVGTYTFASVVSNHAISALFTEGQPYVLTVSVVGNGSVNKSPDSPTYAPGSPVYLTAVPDSGWVFDHWEGHLTGSVNPSELIMDSDKLVTAVFVEEGSQVYTLAVSTSGSGVVTVDPNQGSYPHGTVVTLTAVPDTGWAFDHWEGDLTGANNPGQLTMVKDSAVTAVFVEAQYILTIQAQGSGSVAKDPDLAGYDHGAIVNLTASASAGWMFDHWEGDISGSNNPAQLVMDADKQVTAVFLEAQHTLTLTIVGNGTVTKNPDLASYVDGAVVNLSAAADAGWVFDHWEGDLSGAVNPTQIIMNGDKTVTAVFVLGTHTLIVNSYGSGTVVKDPDQTGFSHGTVVTLTAVPEPGWAFDHWENDLSGSTNPAQLTMDSNKVVTAVFLQEHYTVTVNVTGQGSVSLDPNQASYLYGALVNLTAVPSAGWAFDHWEGDLTGSLNPGRITIDGNQTITAVFAPAFTLNVLVTGSGTVDRVPNLAAYPQNAQVELTAKADPGWTFDRWEGNLTGSVNPSLITMDSNKTVTAVFTQDEYTLTVNITGSGSVTKNPDQATYQYNDVVTLTAVPDAGWVLDHWEGDASGSTNPLGLVIQGDMVVTAVFVQPHYTLNVGTSGNGSVTKDPDQATYGLNQVVTLTAVPDPGWRFDQWSGDLSGSANPAQITMNSDKTVTATFVAGQYTLTVNISGNGSVTKVPDQVGYDYGTTVTLTAVPDADWSFSHWEGDLTGSVNPAQLDMTADRTVTAVFSGQCTILFVDDDDGESYETAFIQALDANGCIYDTWDVYSQGSPGLGDLVDYGLVIWTTGADYSFGTPVTLTAADQQNLMDYLDAGGRLFLSSQEVLYDNAGTEPFFTDYLHVGSHTDDESVDYITGTGDVISGNTDTITLSYPYTNYADDISTDGTSLECYTNENGALSGIRSEIDPFRTVFFAFPFEAIPNAAPNYHRDRIMANIVTWLCAAITPDTTPPTVAITSPEDGATVAGMTLITADADDDRIVDRVGFRIDGGAWVFDYARPFSHFWDTTTVADGQHTIEAQAFDRADNASTIDQVGVVVDQSANLPEKYALVIGISDYMAISDLSYCDEDASEWYHYLVMKGYNHIWVLGDGHANDFPQYDDDARESNIKAYIQNIVALADDNDWIAITFSGHGSGNGNWDSYYCAYDCGAGTGGEDGDFEDWELVDLLTPSIAEQTFVFFDSCFSGGMGDDLMDMNDPDPLYCNTTCTEDGYGYDDPTHQMGAWTWQFLIDTLRNHYSDNNIDMETAFDYAHSNYPHSGGDECMEFDSHSGSPFYLALPPWTSPKAGIAPQRIRPVPPFTGQTLLSRLPDKAAVEIFRTHFAESDGEKLATRTRITGQPALESIREMLQPEQVLSARASRCVFSYQLTFVGESGKTAGVVGICHSPTPRQELDAVFVPYSPGGEQGVRHGLKVSDGPALIGRLKGFLRP